MVLHCPIRRRDESQHQTSGHSRRDFVDVRGKLAGPPPRADTLGIGPALAAWEVNAEVVLDSGASRDFVSKRTVMKRGWQMEAAAHTIDVQVADGRVLSLDTVAAVELQLAPGRIYRTKAYVMPTHGHGTQSHMTYSNRITLDNDPKTGAKSGTKSELRLLAWTRKYTLPRTRYGRGVTLEHFFNGERSLFIKLRPYVEHPAAHSSNPHLQIWCVGSASENFVCLSRLQHALFPTMRSNVFG